MRREDRRVRSEFLSADVSALSTSEMLVGGVDMVARAADEREPSRAVPTSMFEAVDDESVDDAPDETRGNGKLFRCFAIVSGCVNSLKCFGKGKQSKVGRNARTRRATDKAVTIRVFCCFDPLINKLRPLLLQMAKGFLSRRVSIILKKQIYFECGSPVVFRDGVCLWHPFRRWRAKFHVHPAYYARQSLLHSAHLDNQPCMCFLVEHQPRTERRCQN